MNPRGSPTAALACTFLLWLALAAPIHAAKIVLVAGGTENRTDIPAARAMLKEPFGVDFDRAGNLFIIEMASGNRLLKVDAKRILSHVAGQLMAGDSGDGGPALRAHFNGPHNLAVLPDGDVLIADTWNGRVRCVGMAQGVVTALPGFNVPAAQARASGPYCIALNSDGTELYI